jgi:hypothetical protein
MNVSNVVTHPPGLVLVGTLVLRALDGSIINELLLLVHNSNRRNRRSRDSWWVNWWVNWWINNRRERRKINNRREHQWCFLVWHQRRSNRSR